MIIFLDGPDTYRAKQKLKDLISQFQQKRDERGLSIIKLEGEKLTVDKFRQAVMPSGLFTAKRCIVIEDLFSANKDTRLFQEIESYLKKFEGLGAKKEGRNKERENVIIFMEAKENRINKKNKKEKNEEEKGREEKNKKLLEFLRKQKYSQHFQIMKKNELSLWIARETKKRGGQITPEAIEILVSCFNSDLWQISQEIDKALAYSKGKIDQGILTSLSFPRPEEKIFALIDALIVKNKKEAVRRLAEFLTHQNSSLILSNLIRQFRIILIVKERETKKSLNVSQLAKEFNLHPYSVQKALWQAKKYRLDELKKIYQECLKIDWQLKTTNFLPELLLDLLIAKM